MTISLERVTDLPTLLALETVKPDAFMGAGPVLGWGRIYGGQVVAQALRAAALTVEAEHRPHSLHAYFVRAGNEHQPVLYEVERVRDGRSFTTRQVVAYQAGGAILNLIASFQIDEDGDDVQSVVAPSDVTSPEDSALQVTNLFLDHRVVRYERDPEPRVTAWLRANDGLGDDPVLHACALAYLSDENPLGAAIMPHPLGGRWEELMTASLDHAVWFHRAVRADEWLLFDSQGYGVANARGLAFVGVFDTGGRHVASIAQEGLVRTPRWRQGSRRTGENP
jgi:acyl-CoA thioesterase-2